MWYGLLIEYLNGQRKERKREAGGMKWKSGQLK